MIFLFERLDDDMTNRRIMVVYGGKGTTIPSNQPFHSVQLFFPFSPSPTFTAASAYVQYTHNKTVISPVLITVV